MGWLLGNWNEAHVHGHLLNYKFVTSMHGLLLHRILIILIILDNIHWTPINLLRDWSREDHDVDHDNRDFGPWSKGRQATYSGINVGTSRLTSIMRDTFISVVHGKADLHR